MQKQKTEVKVPLILLILIIVWSIFAILIATTFGIQNKHHRETIKIYEEYYELDEEMDFLHRRWTTYYQHYTEVEYYLKYRTEKYLRYLELKQIIGEMKK